MSLKNRLVVLIVALSGLLVVAAGLGALGAAETPIAPAEALLHLELRQSVPAADSVVTTLPEIRLWFTEVPLFQSTTIRLLDSRGEALPIGATTRAPDDGRIYFATIPRALPAGTYSVSWHTLASDGHAISEEFAFTLRAAED